MKKNGFTLIELLSVIVILSILFLIITPTVNNIILNSKEKILDENINTILIATKDWLIENPKFLPKKGKTININLSQLKQLGYVDVNIKNPKTGELFSNSTNIIIENIGKNVSKTYEDYTLYSGDYKFSLDINTILDDTEFDENSPNINLQGDIVYLLDLNSDYKEPGYVALSKNGKIITDSVSIVIRNNKNSVLEIDTSKLGVYYIDYTVTNNEKTTTVTRTVIITDISVPKIEFDKNIVNTISVSDTSFNLKEGVSCVDNSGNCSITNSGSINLGVRGKYVIKYTAVDGSGNTTTSKRVITIK